jgi:glycosyltransferase involved in cell wall biosynthesis
VISQVYPPDAAAVGQYIADACEEIAARGWDVVVYTSARGYDDPSRRYPAREHRRGVMIRRLPFSSFGKRSIPIRLLAQVFFLTQATVRGLFAGRFTSLIVSTSPPFAGFFGALLSIVKRAPLTWWVMDLNPDQMIAAGKLNPNAFLARVFDWMNRVTIRQSRAVVVLDRYMKERVLAKLPAHSALAAKVYVLPPWSLDSHLRFASDEATAFRRDHGLTDRLVVMYSGNHSDQNPLDTLLAAADALAEREDLKFLFVGGGNGKADIDRRVTAGARNILSLPYQPIERLAATLGAADVHPCKIYSAMAVGKPILLFGPDRCHAADILHGERAGWHVSHGDVAATVAALEEAASLSHDARAAMGNRASELIARDFSRQRLLAQFVEIVCP